MVNTDRVFRVNPDLTSGEIAPSFNTLPAAEAHMEGLLTWRAFPQEGLTYPDPFLLLNHHGPQFFTANNSGLPFGPHPHRGFETLTFIVRGELLHADSLGRESVMGAGGIQWMTAGSGLVHAEISSREFMQNGGELEILQLWMNLPAALKMTQPNYQGFNREAIPALVLDEKGSTLKLIAGRFEEFSGPAGSITGLFMSELLLKPGAELKLYVPQHRSLLLYAISGKCRVNGVSLERRCIAMEESAGSSERQKTKMLHFTASEPTLLTFGHGDKIAEPLASYGPFVMNTEAEIHEAISDFRSGKMGNIEMQNISK